MSHLPPEAFVVGLSLLPGCGQTRLRALLDAARSLGTEGLWRDVAAGRLLENRPSLEALLGRDARAIAAKWTAAAGDIDCGASWCRLQRDGIGIWFAGSEGYPPALVDDPDPPPILFWQGDPEALVPPGVAIVGTRRCTAYGTDVARELGRDLSLAGIAVVSGLALGIDGAAHEGALAGHRDGGAAPVAVVGSGLDVVYPPRHRALWRRVAEAGLLMSESPPGALPEGWRFPRRNRILAGLSHVVVVVESHAGGGSLSTVRAAVERGVQVMAVPGSIRSPSSTGTNRLLADGVAPVADVDDIVVALSLEGIQVGARTADASGDTSAETTVAPAPADPEAVRLLAAVDWTPTATEVILRRTGMSLTEASTGLVRLEVQGLVRKSGSWWERASGHVQVPARG